MSTAKSEDRNQYPYTYIWITTIINLHYVYEVKNQRSSINAVQHQMAGESLTSTLQESSSGETTTAPLRWASSDSRHTSRTTASTSFLLPQFLRHNTGTTNWAGASTPGPFWKTNKKQLPLLQQECWIAQQRATSSQESSTNTPLTQYVDANLPLDLYNNHWSYHVDPDKGPDDNEDIINAKEEMKFRT